MNAATKKTGAAATLDISNLNSCILDSCKGAMDGDTGPQDPMEYNKLMGRLTACRDALPPLYRDTVYEPYLKIMNSLGQDQFTKILLRDQAIAGPALLMFDIAHTILQRGERFAEKATDAFQEVVSDLYDGFLSDEDRRKVKRPDYEVIAPLVKWGRPSYGPYTLPVTATESFGLHTAIVNLPPANSRMGLYAWAALGHETSGHDILSADEGLLRELQESVEFALDSNKLGNYLVEYWTKRIDETASDILGILNMGPAATLGMIGFFRGLNEAYSGSAILRNGGDEDDYHPSDIIRGYLGASAIRLLKFSRAGAWGSLIETETKKDSSKIMLGGNLVDSEKARQSAEVVASVLINGRMESLENHSLGQIQNWHDSDEARVLELATALKSCGPLLPKVESGFYAAHVVAAATISAAGKDGDVGLLFDNMLTILQRMHNANPSWGPLYVAHPGDLVPHRVYNRTPVVIEE